jgi:acyl carrier protein
MTRRALLDLIADEMGLEAAEVTAQALIVEDLGWDSLDMVEVVLMVEEALEIDVPDDWMEGISTLGELFALPAVAARLTR